MLTTLKKAVLSSTGRRAVAMTAMLLPHLAFGRSPSQEHIEAAAGRATVSYESLQLPANERLGLAGGAMLFDHHGWLSIGPGFYGALSGERGGFITLGLCGEARRRIARAWVINAGGFIGAGGGRDGLVLTGGGLMLRTHLGLQFQTAHWGEIGGGLSYVTFPYGSIHSVQPFVYYQYPFRAWLIDGWMPPANRSSDSAAAARTHEFSTLYRHYAVPSGVQTDSGRPQHDAIGLLGVEWDGYLGDHYFLKVEAEGASSGESNGYMQIVAGAGYRWSLTSTAALKLSTGFGPAGGGDVATGGGLIATADLSLQQFVSSGLYLEAGAGYVRALDGDLRAMSLSVKAGYHFSTPPGILDGLLSTHLDAFERKNVRWRITHQTYFGADSQWRYRNAGSDINLLGFQADYFIRKSIFLTGQSFAAYQGKAGAYMTGLVGAGILRPLGRSPLTIEAEALLGAAGGGGTDVGSGLVWQINGGIGYRLGPSFSLVASVGRITAPNGHFAADVLSIALAHRLTVFTR